MFLPSTQNIRSADSPPFQDGFKAKIKGNLWKGQRLHLETDKGEAFFKIHAVAGPLFALLGKAIQVKLKGGETVYVNKASVEGYLHGNDEKSKKIVAFFHFILRKNEIKGMNPQVKALFHYFPVKFLHTSRSKFNTAADNLKSNSDWKEILKEEMETIPLKQLESLPHAVPILKLRGYDREVLHEIFTVIKNRVQSESPNSPAIKQLEKLIENTEVEVYESNQIEKKYLEAGKLNAVQLVRDKSTNKVIGVFKPDSAESISMITMLKEQYFGTSVAAGIPAGKKARFSSRAVASSVVDEMLYGDKNRISVHTRFAVVGGQRGILMSKAEGNYLRTKIVEENLKLTDKLRAFCNAQIKKNGKLSNDGLKHIAKELGYRKVKIKVISERHEDGKTIRQVRLVGKRAKFYTVIKNESKKEEIDIDLKNSETLDDLIRLQIKDIINGECDRHTKNYYIDPKTKKVKAIDDDCSFGINAIPEVGDVRQQPPIRGVVPNNGSLMLRMPLVVSEGARDAVNQLYANRQSLRSRLAPFISSKEIEATIHRLEMLHAHINNPKTCKVVPKEELSREENIRLMDSNNSLYGREVFAYDSNKSNNLNYLRAHRPDNTKIEDHQSSKLSPLNQSLSKKLTRKDDLTALHAMYLTKPRKFFPIDAFGSAKVRAAAIRLNILVNEA